MYAYSSDIGDRDGNAHEVTVGDALGFKQAEVVEIEKAGYLPLFHGENLGLRVNISPADTTFTVPGIYRVIEEFSAFP
ncbi:MAG: hypothetical protein RBT11_19285 [Desulfobacterales bacterium]|jgi:hypothetical protein|nr:hypothetical protein [Desulfobacterales bacterium]